MPKKPLVPCRYPGCPELVEGGYCEGHGRKVEDRDREYNRDRHRYYDKHKRDKQADKFYHSSAWKRTRRYVLNMYNGLDIYAFYVDKEIAPATTVHHIIELREDWSRRLDVTNLFPTSESNHNVIDAMYAKDKKGTQELLFGLLEKYQKQFKK